MIYKGSQKQGNIYKGGIKIGKIYKGSQLVYQSISSNTEYTISTEYAYWGVISVSLNPIIPNGKKYKVTLLSQDHGNYTLNLYNSSSGTGAQTIYSVADGINNYNIDLISQNQYDIITLSNYNAPNSSTTIRVRVTIY